MGTKTKLKLMPSTTLKRKYINQPGYICIYVPKYFAPPPDSKQMPAAAIICLFWASDVSRQTEDSCQTNYVRLERHWRREMTDKGPQGASLTKVLMRTFRTRIVITTVLLLFSSFLGLLGPVSGERCTPPPHPGKYFQKVHPLDNMSLTNQRLNAFWNEVNHLIDLRNYQCMYLPA